MHLRAPTSALLALLAACAAEGQPPSSSPSAASVSEPVPDAAPLDFAAFDARVERRLASEPRVRGAVALVLHKEHGIVHQRAYGAFTLDRTFALGTTSALLSAGILLRLVEQGRIGLDDRLSDRLSAWGTHKPSVTVAQLLSGSAGLPSLDQMRSFAFGTIESPPTIGAHLCQRHPAGSLSACGRAIYEDDAPETNQAPDAEFGFGGSQLQLAGALAEEVSGRSWDELVEETYRAPCDVQSLGYRNFHPDESLDAPYAYPIGFDGSATHLAPTANPSIDSGAYINGPDLAQLLLMHLRGGRCGDRQVLGEDTVARMQRNRIGAVYGGTTGSPLAGGYGLGWFVNEGSQTVSAPGSHGSSPLLDLRRGYAVLVLLEEEYIMGAQFLLDLKPLLDAMFPVL